ncbi:MAG: nucleotidyltransferase family protein [Thermoanaerobaculia bacterium]
MKLGELEIDDSALGRICRRYGVRRLSVFGSRLRGAEGPTRDVDVLVEFEEGRHVGLRFISLQDELTALFGRDVDLCTRGFLSPHFRERVVSEAVPFYEAA